VFPALLQEHGQAGAEAARSLDRPQATANNVTIREVEQLLVARGVGTGGGVGEDPAEMGDGGRGQGVAVGVDADDAVDELCQHGHAEVPPGEGRPWSASAWEESPRGITVTGHNPYRVGQAADQASEVGQADAGTTADSSELKAAQRAPVAQRVIPRCQRQSLTAILPDRLHHTDSFTKA
jgi:hypothetical protein